MRKLSFAVARKDKFSSRITFIVPNSSPSFRATLLYHIVAENFQKIPKWYKKNPKW